MKLQGEFELTEIGDEIIACSLGDVKPKVVVLNETGALLWRLLEKGCAEAEMTDALTREFEVTDDQAQADIAAFLETLKAHGVL